VPLSRWGIEGSVSVLPPARRSFGAIGDGAEGTDSSDGAAPAQNQKTTRTGPDVIVIQPSEPAPPESDQSPAE
jgi:hypothetical protein